MFYVHDSGYYWYFIVCYHFQLQLQLLFHFISSPTHSAPYYFLIDSSHSWLFSFCLSFNTTHLMLTQYTPLLIVLHNTPPPHHHHATILEPHTTKTIPTFSHHTFITRIHTPITSSHSLTHHLASLTNTTLTLLSSTQDSLSIASYFTLHYYLSH